MTGTVDIKGGVKLDVKGGLQRGECKDGGQGGRGPPLDCYRQLREALEWEQDN